MDETVMARAIRLTQEFVWQLRISRGECPLCGAECGCKRGRRRVDDRAGRSGIQQLYRPKS